MFRRKEDSLFDTSTDPNQAEPTESVTVVSPSSSATSTTPSSTTSSSSSSASPLARGLTGSAGSAFRPGTPLTGEMTRNRMPESKSSSSSSPSSSASADRGNKFGKRILTVGNDILLKGEIATCDRLVIEGKVDATLNEVHTVEIAETGSFKGAAQIEDAEISGLFEGDLTVRNRLIIYSTGKVRGKITYGEIEIQRGGELIGEIKTSNAQPNSGTRPRKDEKAAAA